MVQLTRSMKYDIQQCSERTYENKSRCMHLHCSSLIQRISSEYCGLGIRASEWLSLWRMIHKAARSWCRHQMVTFSALLAFCAGNSPTIGEFPSQRPVTRSFDVFFDLRLNKRLVKPSWSWWFETPSRLLWRHCYVMPISSAMSFVGRSFARTERTRDLRQTSIIHHSARKCQTDVWSTSRKRGNFSGTSPRNFEKGYFLHVSAYFYPGFLVCIVIYKCIWTLSIPSTQ